MDVIHTMCGDEMNRIARQYGVPQCRTLPLLLGIGMLDTLQELVEISS